MLCYIILTEFYSQYGDKCFRHEKGWGKRRFGKNHKEFVRGGKGKLGRSERVALTYIYTTKCKIDS